MRSTARRPWLGCARQRDGLSCGVFVAAGTRPKTRRPWPKPGSGARAGGVEPPTFGSVVRRSVQLSYARTGMCSLTLRRSGLLGGVALPRGRGAGGAGRRSRTPNLRIRSPTLCPIELCPHICSALAMSTHRGGVGPRGRGARGRRVDRRGGQELVERVAETEGFEPSVSFLNLHAISNRAPSATRTRLPKNFRRTRVGAEAVGFEPTVPLGTAVFKTAALNHSATPPQHGRC
jgi:hypothetical protein